MYPKKDTKFETTTVAKVTGEGESGWGIERSDGWSFFVPASSPVKPEPGMEARFYGDGIGRPVRGLFLAGQKVFYRTEEEDRQHHLDHTYGKTAEEWLARWDKGESCWSIEMGGLGPGYEQAIQITVAEILRHLIESKYPVETWTEVEHWKRDREKIEKAGFAIPRICVLGLSGAQWGAALHLAVCIYRDGPIAVMTDERCNERKIQVSRTFPADPANDQEEPRHE